MYDIVYNFRHLEFFEMMRNADEKQLASRFENVSSYNHIMLKHLILLLNVSVWEFFISMMVLTRGPERVRVDTSDSLKHKLLAFNIFQLICWFFFKMYLHNCTGALTVFIPLCSIWERNCIAWRIFKWTQKKNCVRIMLWSCRHVVCRQNGSYAISCSWWFILNYEHNYPWC